ncbi:hypothetical protein BDZ45DRAFT_736203 [Acephala macrosclerotiorum]|nr:hypothetical protein BDZ45DRAFT_736203 [Acephala macrosclerotiorum]
MDQRLQDMDYSMRESRDPADQSTQYIPQQYPPPHYQFSQGRLSQPFYQDLSGMTGFGHPSIPGHFNTSLPAPPVNAGLGFGSSYPQQPAQLSFEFEGKIYNVIQQDQGHSNAESSETILVKRVTARKSAPVPRNERSDALMPRYKITKREMDAIRRGHAKYPKPSFAGKGPDYVANVQISLTEVEALNAYRNEHGGAQVKLADLEGNKKAIAKRKANSDAYDAKLKERADIIELEEDEDE